MFRLKISHMFTFKHKHHILKFYPSYLSRILWVNPNHAHSGSEVEDFVWKYLRTDDIFVDIGANIGTVTLEASKKIGHNGKIFSFEANPKVFEFLKGNVNLNHSKNIELYNLALGEKRAETIKEIMLINGVSKNSIEVVSYGEENPAVMGKSEETHSLNRRVEIIFSNPGN